MLRDASGKIDWEAQNRLNCDHADNPRIGDFWQEHFMPIAVVLGRPTPETVLVCQETKRHPDRKSLTWDLAKCQVMQVSEFSKMVRYSGIPDKCWADVDPEAMPQVREEAIDVMFGKS